MYIVNTTFLVESQDQDRWLFIIKNKYIPLLRESGFDRLTFTRVISIEVVEQFTYSLQVAIDNLDEYKMITNDIFPEYTTIASPLFGDRVLWFSSLMKKLDV